MSRAGKSVEGEQRISHGHAQTTCFQRRQGPRSWRGGCESDPNLGEVKVQVRSPVAPVATGHRPQFEIALPSQPGQ